LQRIAHFKGLGARIQVTPDPQAQAGAASPARHPGHRLAGSTGIDGGKMLHPVSRGWRAKGDF
jgi:hypothetical protein